MIKSKISALMKRVLEAEEQPDYFSFLPAIYRSLRVMRKSIDFSADKRSRMAGGLGRLVTEDYAFSESALGDDLLQLADEFALLDWTFDVEEVSVGVYLLIGTNTSGRRVEKRGVDPNALLAECKQFVSEMEPAAFDSEP